MRTSVILFCTVWLLCACGQSAPPVDGNQPSADEQSNLDEPTQTQPASPFSRAHGQNDEVVQQSGTPAVPPQPIAKPLDTNKDIQVSAGADFWADEFEDIKLYGTASAIDNRRLNVEWLTEEKFAQKYLEKDTEFQYLPDRPIKKISIINRNSLDNAGFKAPDVETPHIIKIYLVATDEKNSWAYDEIEITINPVEPPPTAFTELDFPDRALLECVSQVAGRQGIMFIDKLRTLTCHDQGIRDLTGIEQFYNLISLDLTGNKIVNANILYKLKNLSSLKLGFNHIRDIQFLKDLEHLAVLNLANNPLDDIKVVASLKMLHSLNLNKTNVSEVGILIDMANLQWISLNGMSNLNCRQFFQLKRSPKHVLANNATCQSTQKQNRNRNDRDDLLTEDQRAP